MHLRLPREALLWRGEHEPEVQNAILAKVGPGAVVYDIAAHVGTMALGAALLLRDLGLAMETSRPVFPETLVRTECQTSVPSPCTERLQHTFVVRFGTCEISLQPGEVRKGV